MFNILNIVTVVTIVIITIATMKTAISLSVSYCCYNKVSQSYWLEVLKSMCPECCILSGASRGESCFLAIPNVMVFGDGGWLSHKIVSNSWAPLNGSLPSFSVHGLLQVRILEWVAISSSRGSS